MYFISSPCIVGDESQIFPLIIKRFLFIYFWALLRPAALLPGKLRYVSHPALPQRAWRRLGPGRNLSFQFEQVHTGELLHPVLYFLLPADDQGFLGAGGRVANLVGKPCIV